MPHRTLLMLPALAMLLSACGKPAETPNAAAVPPAPAASAKPTAPAAPLPATAPASVSTTGGAPYKVVDGKVDANTLIGWKAWRSAACERCHGPSQEGLVGPSLIESLKTLGKEDVKTTVLNGRVDKGMPSHPFLADRIDNLYAYLKGRSDGAIPAGRLESFEP